MYNFSDLSIFRKSLVIFVGALLILSSIPLTSALLSLFSGYKYDHLLVVSMVYYQTDIVNTILAAVIVGFVIVTLCVYVIKTLLPKQSLYGDARLATHAEMNKNNLFNINDESILVGQYKNKMIAYNGDLHVFLAALTGSGKGVGFVVPNLLNWGGSAIVLDIKREAYDITAKYREKGLKSKISIFNPLEDETDGFNVFDYIAEGDRRIDDIQRISDTLILVDDEYFDPMAQHLFQGLTLLILEQGDFLSYQKTIGQIYRILGSPVELGEHLSNIITLVEKEGRTLSEGCKNFLFSYINEPEKPRGGIRSSLVRHLALWANPLIDRATSFSSFDLTEFRVKKNTLYLVCSPGDLERLNSVFRLLIVLFINKNAQAGEELGKKNFKIPVLMLLDEFISLGPMPKLVHALSFIRSFGIKIATVIQSPSQLRNLYGDAAEAYEENHRAAIMFRPHRMSNAKIDQMAEAIGHVTALSTSRSKPQFLTASSGSRTVTQSETQSFLVKPDQIRAMPDNKEFIMIDGLRPIYANKIYYYKNKNLKKKLFGVRPLPKSIKGYGSSPKTPVYRNSNTTDKQKGLDRKINSVHVPDNMSNNDIGRITDELCQAIISYKG